MDGGAVPKPTSPYSEFASTSVPSMRDSSSSSRSKIEPSASIAVNWSSAAALAKKTSLRLKTA